MGNMNIKIELSVDEINHILNVLAERPYAEVAELIGKIKGQGEKQLEEKSPTTEE